MRSRVCEIVVATEREKLWRALVDVRRWPEWDAGLEAVEVEGEIAPGHRFTLKPRGGPAVTISIETLEPPARFVDVAHLPLAKMRTTHELNGGPAGTRVRVSIQVSGPLAILWDLVLARKQVSGAAAQTEALARFAERRA